MKLQDISAYRIESAPEVYVDVDGGDDSPSRYDHTAYPQEVIELLKARTSNQLFNCMLLAGDEMELANHTISKLYSDPCYQPSMTVLQALRAINAKHALCATPADQAAPESQPVIRQPDLL